MRACEPSSMIRKTAKLTAAIVAAVFLWLVVTQPPRFATASGVVADAIRARTVAGAFHVHSTRSDGAGDRSTIARAAARAGLKFVILTDHGDATRTPDPPAYVEGVLCIDAVEVSTNGGHLIALDMPAAPYPLGGEPAAVVEDVTRLGGMPIVAHPDSPKGELAWKDWALANWRAWSGSTSTAAGATRRGPGSREWPWTRSFGPAQRSRRCSTATRRRSRAGIRSQRCARSSVSPATTRMAD